MIVYPATIFGMENEEDREYMMDIYQRYHCIMCKTIARLTDRKPAMDMIINKSCVEMIKEVALLKKLDSITLQCCVVSIVKNTYLRQITQRDSFFGDAQNLHLSIQVGFRQIEWDLAEKGLRLLQMKYNRKIVTSEKTIEVRRTGGAGIQGPAVRRALN